MAELMVGAKPWWHSKTLWVNVLTLIAAGLGGEYGPLPFITTEQALMGLAVVNVVLRVMTATRLTGAQEKR